MDIVAAAAAGDVATVTAYLERGGDPDVRADRGWTPLIAAARNGHARMVDLLLAHGASPDLPNHNGTTPLMFAKTDAFGSGDLGIMERLVAAGADVNRRDNAGLTILHYTETRAEKLVNFLRDLDAVR